MKVRRLLNFGLRIRFDALNFAVSVVEFDVFKILCLRRQNKCPFTDCPGRVQGEFCVKETLLERCC